MLEIFIDEIELFDEKKSEIIKTKPVRIKLEHSLLSISKWESKWHVPFLKNEEKTQEQIIDYIRCMTITQNVDPVIYIAMPIKTILEIKKYMDDSMTATWFADRGASSKRNRVVTSELIYCWMAQNQIPFECDKWNFNRLMALLQVCSLENEPKKKMASKNVLKQNAALNRQRKQVMRTNG